MGLLVAGVLQGVGDPTEIAAHLVKLLQDDGEQRHN